jgi:hypothetical protein
MVLSAAGMDWSRLEKVPAKHQQQEGQGTLRQQSSFFGSMFSWTAAQQEELQKEEAIASQPSQQLQQQQSFLGGIFRRQSLHKQQQGQAGGVATAAADEGGATPASAQDEASPFCAVDLPLEGLSVTNADTDSCTLDSADAHGDPLAAGEAAFLTEEAKAKLADREAAAQEALVSEWQPDTNSAGDKW